MAFTEESFVPAVNQLRRDLETPEGRKALEAIASTVVVEGNTMRLPDGNMEVVAYHSTRPEVTEYLKLRIPAEWIIPTTRYDGIIHYAESTEEMRIMLARVALEQRIYSGMTY